MENAPVGRCAPRPPGTKKRPLLTKHHFLRHPTQVPEKTHQSSYPRAWTKLGRSNAVSVDMNPSGPHLGPFMRKRFKVFTIVPCGLQLRIYIFLCRCCIGSIHFYCGGLCLWICAFSAQHCVMELCIFAPPSPSDCLEQK